MLFSHTGEAAPRFHVLGHHAYPSYLLEAPRPALFDAGFSALGPQYLSGLRQILGPKDPAWLFITHSHFDHVGAGAFLKKNCPGLAVASSPKTAWVLARPNALQLIASLNNKTAQHALGPEAAKQSEPFRPFAVDQTLVDGDRINLGGGLSVEVLATPGHTWDFLSFYVPERRILIASEAVGCADRRGYIFTEFLVDYEAYVESLKRLSRLPVEVLCQGHLLVYGGTDARSFFGRSLQAAQKYRERVLRLLDEENGDIEKTVARVKKAEYDPLPPPKQAPEAYLLNTRSRVEHLAASPARTGNRASPS